MNLIGLSGIARSGKDTTADYLVSKYGFKKMALADYIKEVAELAGWDGLKDERGRRYLQHLGDVMREYSPNIMLTHLESRIRICTERYSQAGIVISDVRLETEIKWLKIMGGSSWLVLRDTKTTNVPAHPTEQSDKLDRSLFDFVFDNNGSFEAHYNGIDMAMTRIQKGKV